MSQKDSEAFARQWKPARILTIIGHPWQSRNKERKKERKKGRKKERKKERKKDKKKEYFLKALGRIIAEHPLNRHAVEKRGSDGIDCHQEKRGGQKYISLPTLRVWWMVSRYSMMLCAVSIKKQVATQSNREA